MSRGIASWVRIMGAGIALFITLVPAVSAATPPTLINYEGVLRSATDQPLTGSYDMVFHLFDAQTAGAEILLDRHLTVNGQAVPTTGGLFNVAIGSGEVLDGSGAGTYTSLADVFRDYGTVWLEVQIGAETLTPRTRVLAAAYALSSTDAVNLGGKPASSYLDTSSTAQTKSGPLSVSSTAVGTIGVTGTGGSAGGYFTDVSGGAHAYVGYGAYGISAYGAGFGGYFQGCCSGISQLGVGDDGIHAFGNGSGGFFKDNDNSGYARVGYGDTGIYAAGSTAGGEFHDAENSSVALVAAGYNGISAYGNVAGGLFGDLNGSGLANVGYGDEGISAFGNLAGGLFGDLDSSGYANVAYGDEGIYAAGNTAGGEFHDSNGSGYAYVGYGDRGIWGKGLFAGGTFSHTDNVTFWADVATPTYKIHGTGTVAFVQNHPYDKDKVVVYNAPEGDEVAVYTRGTARLVNGEAHVTLGDTFHLVANPDLGLTAHLTPRGDPVSLSVESVSTSELRVRGPNDSNADFDFLVYGLRIGFEELAIVQPKEREAFLPDVAAVQEPYSAHPELRASNALERFKGMRLSRGIAGETDLSQARSLAAAVDRGRESILAKAGAEMEAERAAKSANRPNPSGPGSAAGSAMGSGSVTVLPIAPVPPPVAESPHSEITASTPTTVRAEDSQSGSPVLAPVSGVVSAGDVLVLDVGAPGALRTGDSGNDRGVAGCALEPPVGREVPPGQAAIATGGIAPCKVDASFGAIAVGDLLTTSSNPGHAMRAGELVEGAAILGKAMEPLAEGTGVVRVLVTLR